MSRLIGWFVDNPVAANLLMLVLLAGGLLSLPTIRQEQFPSIDIQVIQVSVAYPGASPQESEETLCVRIEEALDGTEGIDSTDSLAVEGVCVVTLELLTSADTMRVLNEIKSDVDAIDTFPIDAEKPIVTRLTMRSGVIQVALSGVADERTLKVLGQRLRDDLAALPGISQVELEYVREYEISIEISEATLRRHGLTLGQVAEAVRLSSLDLPGGSVRTASGEILLRSVGQAYRASEFEEIPVLTRPDGTRLLLRDVANVIDGFREGDLIANFDGAPAVFVRVFRVGEEDTIAAATAVRVYLANATWLPDGVRTSIWQDEAKELKERINTLLRNAGTGLLLVILLLALFLNFRLALWVAAGIPVAFAGALFLFPVFDLTISTLAVMAFILVLGIVVDDAIVVGERIHAHEAEGDDPRTAAVEGTSDVSVPVIFGVLTTMAAFLPLLLVPGRMGQFFAVIGTTVITCLFFSLVESQLILPAHLAHRSRTRKAKAGRWTRLQERIAAGLARVAAERYQPLLERAIEWRYLTASIALGALIVTGSVFASGRMRFQFFPGVEGNRVFATVTMPQGVPLEITQAAISQLEGAAQELRAELDSTREPDARSAIHHVLTSIGAQISRGSRPGSQGAGSGTQMAEVAIELIPARERSISADDVGRRWRELTGVVPDAVELSFMSSVMHVGDAIAIQLRGRDIEQLRSAATSLRDGLASFDGVLDIADSFRAGKLEVELELLPEARSLGITQRDLASQVRHAFYGEEVQRIQRGRDDVRVMVRFPESERRSLGDLEDMRIRTASGGEVPLVRVARINTTRGAATIRRTDRERVVNVTADVDRDVTAPEAVMDSLRTGVLPQILDAHPGVSFRLRGEQREHDRALNGLFRAFGVSLLIIYALLAIPLRSYVQPLLIMSAIPVGAVGAIIGHAIMGRDLVFFSMLGIVALSGVVVNDSLVLVDWINRLRRQGRSAREAVLAAGRARFRAILLTSATTFVGLLPLIFIASSATFFMLPIAISLAFGVIFATAITLLLVPSGYLILEDLSQGRLRSKASTDPAALGPEPIPDLH